MSGHHVIYSYMIRTSIISIISQARDVVHLFPAAVEQDEQHIRRGEIAIFHEILICLLPGSSRVIYRVGVAIRCKWGEGLEQQMRIGSKKKTK
jgi:hypothetical protein